MTPTPSPFAHRTWLVGLCCALAVGFAAPSAEAGDQPTSSSPSTQRRAAAPNQRSSPTNRQPAATRQRSNSPTNRQPAATRQRSNSSTNRQPAATRQHSNSSTNRQPAATRQRSNSPTKRPPAATRQRSNSPATHRPAAPHQGSTSTAHRSNNGQNQPATTARNGNAVAWPPLSEYRSNYLPSIRETRRAADAANRRVIQTNVEENSNANRRLASDDPGAFNLRMEDLQRRRAQLSQQRDQAESRASAECGRYQARFQNLNGMGGRTAEQNTTLEGIRRDLVQHCGGARTN